MTGVEQLDFSDQAMTPSALADCYRPSEQKDPWLRRRTHAWGGSEVAPLLVGYGLAPLSASLPGWVLEQAEHYKRLGTPRLVAWKAGLRGRPKGDTLAKKRGRDRERELLVRWRSSLAGRRVDARTVRHADTVPRQFFPLVDRYCHRLAVTPDAWARAHDGSLVAIECKCTYYAPILGVPWHYYVQLQAEMATMEADHGLLVVGEQWVDENEPDGPVRAFVVMPDASTVYLIRAVCVEAWALVEALREERDARRCRALWTESVERMREHRAPDIAELEDVLAGIAGIDELTSFAA